MHSIYNIDTINICTYIIITIYTVEFGCREDPLWTIYRLYKFVHIRFSGDQNVRRSNRTYALSAVVITEFYCIIYAIYTVVTVYSYIYL